MWEPCFIEFQVSPGGWSPSMMPPMIAGPVAPPDLPMSSGVLFSSWLDAVVPPDPSE
jgi:hypothetical protein